MGKQYSAREKRKKSKKRLKRKKRELKARINEKKVVA